MGAMGVLGEGLGGLGRAWGCLGVDWGCLGCLGVLGGAGGAKLSCQTFILDEGGGGEGNDKSAFIEHRLSPMVKMPRLPKKRNIF